MISLSMATSAVLLLLAPVQPALAECPSCPPAPASAEVCGSNLQTYESSCHLGCAHQPGLSELYPGPCSPAEAAARMMRTVDDDATLPDLPPPPASNRNTRRRRSYLSFEEGFMKFKKCFEGLECTTPTCGCADGDWICREKCEWNCHCLCDGYRVDRRMNRAGQVKSCLEEQCPGVQSEMESCRRNCTTVGCDAKCVFTMLQCGCKCNQLGVRTDSPSRVELVAAGSPSQGGVSGSRSSFNTLYRWLHPHTPATVASASPVPVPATSPPAPVPKASSSPAPVASAAVFNFNLIWLCCHTFLQCYWRF
ncbi:uncharacterized protein LOC113206699 [Frankliniella occidentalis]|uniref:Uncharacterized protein LOC113206699 n=1 Tax=Frankliniella occidentalis TaxID=133901 RepID=A0A6J1SCB7_FRAOC|nr:uncharacterized protein LOC113206699 [Frankliniella occidentalis]